ncbi:MAG: two-component system response regulator [Myxococcaceae bacterium]
MEKRHSHGNGQQLLVVDDQPFFSSFLKEKFEELGYSVATADDAFEALSAVGRSAAPVVVLLDLMLPQVSGQQLLRELARGPHASRIRVVLVSSHHSVERVALNHPMVFGRAQKPVDLGELTRMVDGASRVLAEGGSARLLGRAGEAATGRPSKSAAEGRLDGPRERLGPPSAVRFGACTSKLTY